MIKESVSDMLFHCLNTSIYSYLETYGGQSSNLYSNVVHFLTPVLIRHLWQLKTVVFLHWCLICQIDPLKEMTFHSPMYPFQSI
jgi:hypothetical protein